MPLLHGVTSNKPKIDWYNTLLFNYGRNMTFNFNYTWPIFCHTQEGKCV